MKISIVVPCFNEQETIALLRERLEKVMQGQAYDYEIVIVDDGSTDKSVELVRNWIAENYHVVLIQFSRNFGHQQAITAGLKETTGDAVVILDADLQDPPEKIPEMVEEWKKGYKVVLAERTLRKEWFFRKFLFNLFYKIFVFVSDLPVLVNSGVFGLMDRVIVNYLVSLEERNRYIPGLRGWIGFESTTIHYERNDRAAGRPKQSLRRLFGYGLNAIFSFSYKPLRVSLILGVCVSTFFFIYGFILVLMRVLNINVVRGFTTPTVAIFLLGGILLISNGILGEYLARIYDEVKRRPLYIVSKKITRSPSSQELSVQEQRNPNP